MFCPDNYEHEQPNRRRSLQGGHSQDSQTSGNTNTNNPNVTQTTHGNLGSNNSLHATNLDIGTSRPIGYSCSVPATPEHRRYHAAANASDWASMSYSGGGRPMPHPHQEYADMGMGGRGGMRGVPYGYRPRHPHHRYGGASNSQGRIPFRHPSQYRSMPPHAYGFYQQGGRPRPRHMAPLYASARLIISPNVNQWNKFSRETKRKNNVSILCFVCQGKLFCQVRFPGGFQRFFQVTRPVPEFQLRQRVQLPPHHPWYGWGK